ncbi:hypothetical protein OIU79_008630 [Salix purpurea]|uniref:LIM zinc-binding domain-containing protein n=1 Tax=Salix purpurea TaxID=77065 RepID=A0A9Q0TIU2_SALPP|nr:hypothetical protein OIU79_008630 [Salix purpurea]
MGFTGTLEKCKACDKTVYFIELVSADGVSYHKKCFKCSHCNGLLVMSSYSSIDGSFILQTSLRPALQGDWQFLPRKSNPLGKRKTAWYQDSFTISSFSLP